MSHTGNDLDMDPVQAYLAHLAAIGRPATTIGTYRCALRLAGRELAAGLLSYDYEIETWLATRTIPTRAVYRAALRSFYTWALKRKLVSENPAAELEPVHRLQRQPRPVPLDRVQRILAEAREPVRLWVVVGLYAGARCCEIARLAREDVDEQTVILHGKGDRERIVPTHPELWSAVRDLPPGLVAEGRSAHYISWRAAAEMDHIGLPDVTMHRLRHTAGTAWQRATRDIRVTQELLGHASPATTAVYAAASNEDMRTAVLSMPALTAEAATAVGAVPPVEPAPVPPR